MSFGQLLRKIGRDRSGPSLFESVGAGVVPPPQEGADASSLGLSEVQTCTEEREAEGCYRLISAEGGEVVQLQKVGRKRAGEAVKKARRGICRGFTRWSRRRLSTAIAQLNRGKVERAFFVTLTEPAGSVDWKGIERHRRAYFAAFARKWGDRACVFWKKEPQDNGTPHLHLLIFWLTTPPHHGEFIEWQDPTWGGITGNDRGHVACNTKWLNGWRGVASYTSKYFQKLVDDLAEDTGRIWGIHNRKVMPVNITKKVLVPEVGVKVQRALRKLQEKKRRLWLHSAHSPERGRYWSRVRAAGSLDDGGRIKKYTSVAEGVHLLREAGVVVKLVKRRVMFTRSVSIWAEVADEFSGRSEKRYLEKIGEEKESVCSSRHFVQSAEVDRLVAFFDGSADREKQVVSALLSG